MHPVFIFKKCMAEVSPRTICEQHQNSISLYVHPVATWIGQIPRIISCFSDMLSDRTHLLSLQGVLFGWRYLDSSVVMEEQPN